MHAGTFSKCIPLSFLQGNIGYVPQEPWIRQTTLRDNITLGDETSMDNINQVIHACALEADLQTLPDGLHTDIGERVSMVL